MSYEILKKHRETWKKKEVLQRIYRDWYAQIIDNMMPQGPTLEIGGGGGNLKEFFPGLISSDFTFCPWLDVNLDGHYLPFRSRSLANIVVIDVLHHLAKPVIFIKEAQRVLKKNGRLLMLEPCISPISYLIYNYLHQEDVDFTADIFSEEMWGGGDLKNPFDGNMAIPSVMFLREVEKFRKYYDGFVILFLIFMLSLHIQIILWNTEVKIPINLFITLWVSILFFYIGILLENAQQNWFIGIRTPWTLSNKIVWEKTHRLGGKLFKITAIVVLIGIIFPEYTIWFILLPVFASASYLVVYSYFEYQKIS